MEIEITKSLALQSESYPHFDTSIEYIEGDTIITLQHGQSKIELDKSEVLDLILFIIEVGFIPCKNEVKHYDTILNIERKHNEK